MNKLLSTLFALLVASATGQAMAQASAAAPAQATPAAARPGATSIDTKVAMCIGCHGIIGYQASFPEIYRVPMISGQNAKFIAASLTAYKNGDRRHPTMKGIAGSLSEQDINEIAAYYETHGKGEKSASKSREPAPAVAELLKKGACESCHGNTFSNPADPSMPKLAGQHADYLFVALKSYKSDNGATVGRSNPTMGAIAKQFSNAELKALSAYLGSLEGELKTVPQKKFR